MSNAVTKIRTKSADPFPREVMTVDPAFAASVLAGYNAANRPLSEEHARHLAKEIVDGRWMLTPDGIVFSPSSRLLDGQHRLRAVVISGIPVEMYVTSDVPESVFAAMQSVVKPRNGGDAVALHTGIGKHRQEIASALRLLVNYSNQRTNRGTASYVSNLEIAATFDEWPEVADLVGLAQRTGKNTGLNRAACLVGMVLTARQNPSLRQSDWIEGLSMGTNLSAADPRLALRRFAANRLCRYADEHLARYVHAWNAWALGKPMQVVRISAQTPRPLPVAIAGQRVGDTAALDSLIGRV